VCISLQKSAGLKSFLKKYVLQRYCFNFKLYRLTIMKCKNSKVLIFFNSAVVTRNVYLIVTCFYPLKKVYHYDSLSQESSNGVSFPNLILMSPPPSCSKNRAVRSWWKRLGGRFAPDCTHHMTQEI
jgi:hypothetical protein